MMMCTLEQNAMDNLLLDEIMVDWSKGDVVHVLFFLEEC